MEDWHRTIAINLNGTFFTNRAVVPHMMAQNYGRIVNIASIAGKEGNPNASAYSASKAAVIGFTKSLAKELAKTNITVNSVTPAAVRTPIFDQLPQSHIDFMLSKIPDGPAWQGRRGGKPRLLAGQRGMLLLDRRRVRRLGRPRHLLTEPYPAVRHWTRRERSPPCPRLQDR